MNYVLFALNDLNMSVSIEFRVERKLEVHVCVFVGQKIKLKSNWIYIIS